jgi:hypothetical protein
MIEQVVALGITEIAFYYPMLEEQAPMFERIARNVLPALKASVGDSLAESLKRRARP